jgi:hypothetical protein
VERPSAPPTLEARIRAELDGSVVRGRPRRSVAPRLLVAAALVLVAAIAAVVVIVGTGTDGRVSTDLGDRRPLDPAAESEVRAACRRFEQTAFAPYERQQVVGPARAETLTTGDLTRSATITLRTALATAVEDLGAAGVGAPALDRPVDRSLADLDHAVQLVDSGQLDAALGELGHTGNSLLEASLALTTLGVPNCL